VVNYDSTDIYDPKKLRLERMDLAAEQDRPTGTAALGFESECSGSSDLGFAASARFRRRLVSSGVRRHTLAYEIPAYIAVLR